MFANFVPNLLIGLREGLEASLVVSILVAYLVKTNRRDALRPVAIGVAVAVALSIAVAVFLQTTVYYLPFETQELLGGSLSIVAVAFVTYMIFWMRRTARTMRAELEGKLGSALAMGTSAVVLTAFLAVGREGLETAIFLSSTVASASGSAVGPAIGAFVGILIAVAIAYLLYNRAIRFDLAKFFRWTGLALVFIAAGVLSYGFHDLQEAGLLPGINTLAFDFTSWFSATSWYGTLLKATLNIGPAMTVLEVFAWLAYFVPVLYLFLRPSRGPGPKPAPAAPVQQSVSVG